MRNYFKKIRENRKKGFTLVELIVIIVILAILAAALVPALLGYIDEARKSSYNEEAHSILTALQVVEDEKYAAGEAPVASVTASMKTRVDKIVTPTVITSGTIAFKDSTGYSSSASVTGQKDKFTIAKVTDLTFTSQDGKVIVMDFNGSSWTLKSVGGEAQQ